MRPQTMVVDALIAPDQQPDQRQAQRHQLSQPLGAGSLLRIEYDNNLLLGEVVYCQQEKTGWLVGILIEHALSGLAVLSDAMSKASSAG